MTCISQCRSLLRNGNSGEFEEQMQNQIFVFKRNNYKKNVSVNAVPNSYTLESKLRTDKILKTLQDVRFSEKG